MPQDRKKPLTLLSMDVSRGHGVTGSGKEADDQNDCWWTWAQGPVTDFTLSRRLPHPRCLFPLYMWVIDKNTCWHEGAPRKRGRCRHVDRQAGGTGSEGWIACQMAMWKTLHPVVYVDAR